MEFSEKFRYLVLLISVVALIVSSWFQILKLNQEKTTNSIYYSTDGVEIPSTTFCIKWLKDQNGDRVYPKPKNSSFAEYMKNYGILRRSITKATFADQSYESIIPYVSLQSE